MSRKHQSRRYSLESVTEEQQYNYCDGSVVRRINPFGNGSKRMTALEWVAKNQSEKYRRIKK